MVESLSRRGLADDVATELRRGIFAGELKPGERLNEVALASALQVSRGPVRVAIAQLEQEGLVESAWHRGSHVTQLSDQDLDELFDLRLTLETLAIQSLKGRVTEELLSELEQCAEAIDAQAEDAEAQAVIAADLDFHETIFRGTGNKRLLKIWRELRSQLTLLLATRQKGPNLYRQTVGPEHHDLLKALAEGSFTNAEALVKEHIEIVFDQIRSQRGE